MYGIVTDINGAPVTQAGVTQNVQVAVDARGRLRSSPDGGNLNGTLATLAAATTGGSSADQANSTGRGITVGINVTAISGTGATLTVIVEGKDAASGQYFPLLTSTGKTAAGFSTLTVYPGIPEAANVTASRPLPAVYRVSYTVAGTTPSVTATIGASVNV